MKASYTLGSLRIQSTIIALCSVFGGATAFAQFVWDGGGANTNWNAAANWNPDGAPPDSSATELVYTGTAAQLTSTNTANDFNLKNLTFTSTAASYNIAINNGVGTLLTNGAIIQNSSNAQMFSMTGTGALRLDGGSSTLTGTGTGTVTIGSIPNEGFLNSRSSSGTNTLTVNNATFDVLINSQIVNAGNSFALSKTNVGTLTLRGSNTYTGGTSANGGALVLDYNTVATGNRLNDTAAVGFSGGDLRLLGAAAAATSEIVGAVNVNAEGGSLTLLPGAGQSATFTGATLNRAANSGSILFRGTGLGTAVAGTANTSNVFFTTAPTLVGGAYAANAGTADVGIIAYAFGDTSATGTGAGLVTYDDTAATGVGVRLLTAAEYADYGTATATQNARITASGTITGKVVNSLTLQNTSGGLQTVTIADGSVLAPTSGTFFFSGNAANPITLTRNTAGAGDGAINLAANTSANLFVTAGTVATVDAPILLNTTGGLVIDGGGTVVLNQNIATTGFATTETGIIAIQSGTLRAGAVNIVGVGKTSSGYTSSLVVSEGATWDINGFDQSFNNKGSLGGSFGSTVTNTGANAIISPAGPSGQSGSSTIPAFNGTFTDGTPGDGATTGLISLNLAINSSNSAVVTYSLTHGGHTFNNITARTISGSDQGQLILNSLSATDDNTIFGTVTVGLGTTAGNSRSTLTLNAVADGSTVSKTLGSAPIVLTSTTGTGQTGTVNIRLSAASLAAPLTGTTTWTNDVTLSGSKPNATITLDRNDGVSSGFTHQLDALNLSGASRNLTVTTINNTTLEFTGTTTLDHSSATTDTFTVSAGTLKLGNIVETGTGAKGLTKTGTGTLNISGTATYTGDTAVNAGTLLVNNTTGSGTGSGAVTVATQGTLGGTGTIGGVIATTTVTVNGTVAPGNPFSNGGIGTLTIGSGSQTRNTVFGDGSIFSIQTGAGANNNDMLVMFGGFDLTNNQTLALSGTLDGVTNYKIATWTGTGTNINMMNGFETVTGLTGGYTVQYNANDITLLAVPEPSSALLLLCGLGMLLGFRRR